MARNQAGLSVFIDELATDDVTMSKNDYEWLLGWHLEHNPNGAEFDRLVAYALEDAHRPLNVLAEQAPQRLGRTNVNVFVDAKDAWLAPEQWHDFFSSLSHVIRNAVDHGFTGNEESGELHLRAHTEGTEFVVEVRDDGQGIDWSKVREKAVAAGLPAKSRDDLAEALCHNGFSMRDEVSETSGRGVGMAAVKQSVAELGGSIVVESEAGNGTSWRFRFPQSACTADFVNEIKDNLRALKTAV